MIHYHGLPITPVTAAVKAIQVGHAFVSFAHSEQINLAVEVASSFALDNGAFSAWMSGNPITDWSAYYEWVREYSRCPGFDWAVLPDVIDGDESANDLARCTGVAHARKFRSTERACFNLAANLYRQFRAVANSRHSLLVGPHSASYERCLRRCWPTEMPYSRTAHA